MLPDELLAILVHMTQAMMSACHDGDWTKLITLESERRPLFERFIQRLPELPDSWTEKNKDQLEQLYILEHNLLAVSSREREQCFAELEQVNRGAKACLAYQAQS